MATEFCQKCKQSHPGRLCDYDEKGGVPRRLRPRILKKKLRNRVPALKAKPPQDLVRK